jgi:integrase
MIRGMGNVYLRGEIYWIRYSRNGHLIRESSAKKSEKEARRLLNKRVEESKRPEFVGPAQKRLDLDDLERKILGDYELNGKRSADTVEHCLKHVREYFKYDKLIDITTTRFQEYQNARLTQGAERSTINRESAYVRRGFNLLYKAGDVSFRPAISSLGGENIREGFVNAPEFHAALANVRDDDTRDIVEFLYKTAWRSGEAKTLEWSKVDTSDWVIRLSRKNEKTKRPRVLALEDDLKDIIVRRLAKKRPDCPLVFHRKGRPVKRFEKAFKSACEAAGLAGLVPHDMRRSGIRNFTKAGLGQSEGMSISGHRTDSVYRRYNIIDEEMQRQSLKRVHEHQKREVEQRKKVVPIRQAG